MTQSDYNYLRKVFNLFKKTDNHYIFYSSQQSFIFRSECSSRTRFVRGSVCRSVCMSVSVCMAVCNTLAPLPSFFEEDEAEEAAESSSSKCWTLILGTLILFNSIDCGRLSFQVSRFLMIEDYQLNYINIIFVQNYNTTILVHWQT